MSEQWPPPGPPVRRPAPSAHPTPYQQLLRTHTYAPWRPVVGIAVCAVGFVLVQIVLVPVTIVTWSAFQAGPFLEDVQTNFDADAIAAPMLLGLNVGLASLTLLAWFCVRVVHGMRPRWLTSVMPRMRWRLFWICVGLSAVALLVQVAAGMLLPTGDAGEVSGGLNELTRSTVTLGVVMLLTTPLQAAGEEYLFRGYLLQAFGSFASSRQVSAWVSVVVTALVFAVLHGSQNFPLFFDRFMFALIAGLLVVRTGGLEAGIALHVLNNLLALGIALAYGDLTASLNISEISWWNVPLTLAQSSVYAALVLWVARRMGLQTETRPPNQDPGPRPQSAVAAT